MQGQEIVKYTVYGKRGEFSVINYGATLVSCIVPDKAGKRTDVVPGYGDLLSCAAGKNSFGATTGRVSCRTSGEKFPFSEKNHSLFPNENGNAPHGGSKGFDKRIWNSFASGNKVTMTYFSKNGEEGFPGALDVIAEFYLDENDALHITYTAETDSESPVNLTNQAYFNLNGEGGATIEDHLLTIFSSCITSVDRDLIPTGEFKDVSGTPFDFIRPKKIGADIEGEDEQLKNAHGYDHYFVLDEKENDLAAVAVGDKSGIELKVFTNQNGLKFYSGDFIQENNGKAGKAYGARSAFCIAPQCFPNARDLASFGQPIIRNGEIYQNRIVFVFSTV